MLARSEGRIRSSYGRAELGDRIGRGSSDGVLRDSLGSSRAHGEYELEVVRSLTVVIVLALAVAVTLDRQAAVG